MNSLRKNQVEQLANLTAKVRVAEDAVNLAVDEANSVILGKLNDMIDRYNEVVAEILEFVVDTTKEMENYMEEQNEAWSESDAGSAYMEWKDEWESIDLAEIERVDQIELEADLADSLSELATEPGK